MFLECLSLNERQRVFNYKEVHGNYGVLTVLNCSNHAICLKFKLCLKSLKCHKLDLAYYDIFFL